MTALLLATLLTAEPGFSAPPMVPAVQRAVEASPRDDSRWHLWGLSIAGGVVGIGTWIAGFIDFWSTVHCHGGDWNIQCDSASGWLMAPVVGPYLALLDPSTARANNTGVAAALAVTQGLAIVMCIVGPFIPIGSAKVAVTPTGIGGTF